MIERILKKFNIKTKPEKALTYLFYSITAILVIISVGRMLILLIGDGRINNNIGPLSFTLWFCMPVLGFSYFVNSGLAKNDAVKVNVYVVTAISLGILAAEMSITWINSLTWWLLSKLPNYELAYQVYPELFAPAVKTLSFAIPFILIFRVLDHFLYIYRDDDAAKAVAGFGGLTASSTLKEDGAFSCSTVICKDKKTAVPVVVPEKKRYESTLVQGATGTGKTSAVLLPMSALDLERKFFFREYSKKLGYSLLKKGVAYVTGPYNNEYMNKNFTLNYLKPKRGMEDTFLSQTKNMIQYIDNATGEVVFRSLGITLIENDGKFISDFVGVARNFDIDVLSVDPANPETTLSINPFNIKEPQKAASIIADVLKSMYENEGGGAPGDPFFTQVTLDAFQNLAILLKEMYPILNNGRIASLEDMLELLYNFDKVEEMAEEMKKVPKLEEKYKLLIAYFEKNFYKPSLNINGFEIPGTRGSGRKETERFLYGAITQLNNLLRHPGLKSALCGKSNMIDFDKALENGSVITACSRKGELGIIQSKAFGMFFIMQFQDAVLRRKGNEDSRIPHFLYIDEFPEYLNKDMEVMFTLFRKYRCGSTVAIQNLSQLEKGGKSAAHYRQTVLANTKTQIIFGDTVPEDSKYWEAAFGKHKIPDTTASYDLMDGMKKKHTLEIKKKEKAEAYKIADQGFGQIYFKTKNLAGKTIYGQGKTSFLDSKYKRKHNTLYFNFEKYMMAKPDNPTITINNSDSSDNDDSLFGVNTTTRLMNELKSSNDIVGSKNENYVTIDLSGTANNINNIESNPIGQTIDFDIDFEEMNLPTQDTLGNGGAIEEKQHDSPVINKKKN